MFADPFPTLSSCHFTPANQPIGVVVVEKVTLPNKMDILFSSEGELSPEFKAITIIGSVVLVILLFLCPRYCCRGICLGCCKKHRQHVYELEDLESGRFVANAPSDSDKEENFYAKNLKDFSNG